jgi:hypothetical protein
VIRGQFFDVFFFNQSRSKKTTLYGGNLMISKRVLLIAAALLVVSATGVMAANTTTGDFNVATLNIGATDSLTLNSSTSFGIVTGTATIPTPTPYATVAGYVANGYAGGLWNGANKAINSSKAAADPNQVSALGIVSGDDAIAWGAISSFHGHTPVAGDSLIQYTTYGDNDLSGTVDGTDYFYIDFAYQNGGPAAGYKGWLFGDYNYDGAIDGTDYFYIDYVYQNGFTPFTASAASASAGAPAAVPEPSAVILLVSSALCAFIVYLRKR